jgi:predicted flap endonuclease-1-like 5' DNA nuclease
LLLLAAAALGPGLVTHFGRRAWRPDEVPFGEIVAAPVEVDPDPGEAPSPTTPDSVGDGLSSAPGAPAAPAESGFPGVSLDETPASEAAPFLSDEEIAEVRVTDPAEEGAKPDDASDEAADEAAEASRLLEHSSQVIAELRRVPGITPIYAELLREAGIESLAQLAKLSPQRLLEVASAPGVLAIDLETASRWLRAAQERIDGA